MWLGSLIPVAAAIAFLLLAVLGSWPYGFYTMLRLVVCGAAIYVAYAAARANIALWLWVMVGIALLFNPLVPVSFERELWRLIDLIVAIVFVVLLLRNLRTVEGPVAQKSRGRAGEEVF